MTFFYRFVSTFSVASVFRLLPFQIIDEALHPDAALEAAADAGFAVEILAVNRDVHNQTVAVDLQDVDGVLC